MEAPKKSCIQIFAELIKEDCFVEAMNILDYYILIHKELQIHLSELAIVSARFKRTLHYFQLDVISWEEFDLTNNKVMGAVFNLAKEICAFLEKRDLILLEERALKEMSPEKWQDIIDQLDKHYQNETKGGLIEQMRSEKIKSPTRPSGVGPVIDWMGVPRVPTDEQPRQWEPFKKAVSELLSVLEQTP